MSQFAKTLPEAQAASYQPEFEAPLRRRGPGICSSGMRRIDKEVSTAGQAQQHIFERSARAWRLRRTTKKSRPYGRLGSDLECQSVGSV